MLIHRVDNETYEKSLFGWLIPLEALAGLDRAMTGALAAACAWVRSCGRMTRGAGARVRAPARPSLTSGGSDGIL